MRDEIEITGVLENWYPVLLFEDVYQINGNIYGDVRGRFPDGTYIHTSIVNEGRHPHMRLKEGMVVHTTYSVYRLGKPYKTQCRYVPNTNKLGQEVLK